MNDRLAKQKPGIIGIASAPIGRYRIFDWAIDRVISPVGTVREWGIGLSVPANYNKSCRAVLESDAEWLWLMDDDHIMDQDILLNLLERDVDIVTPLYLRRVAPFDPVVHSDEGQDYYRYNFKYLSGKSGCVDITESGTMPTGGMLIRRNVLEAMKDPWFEHGKIDPEYGSWDLYFCAKAVKAGFKLHLDLDNVMGHIIHCAVWPVKGEDGEYSPDIRAATIT